MSENPYLNISGRKVGLDYKPLVIAEIGINHDGSLQTAFDLVDAAIDSGAEVIKHQTHVVEDEMSKSAKKIIPGGNMLLSKRPELFLPDKWPSYFSKAKGCRVWDLDNNEYIDMSIMGIGTNILGYGNTHVDKAVNKCQNP